MKKKLPYCNLFHPGGKDGHCPVSVVGGRRNFEIEGFLGVMKDAVLYPSNTRYSYMKIIVM